MKVDKAAGELGYCCVYRALFHTLHMKEGEVGKALECSTRRVRQLRRELREGKVRCKEGVKCQQEGI